jgi:hypothetical protein
MGLWQSNRYSVCIAWEAGRAGKSPSTHESRTETLSASVSCVWSLVASLAEPSSIHFTAVTEEIVSLGVARGCSRVALSGSRR